MKKNEKKIKMIKMISYLLIRYYIFAILSKNLLNKPIIFFLKKLT